MIEDLLTNKVKERGIAKMILQYRGNEPKSKNKCYFCLFLFYPFVILFYYIKYILYTL